MSEAQAANNNGHAPDGKFTPGNPGGPGRPRRAIEVDYARVLADAISLADWRKVCDKAVADAIEGDSRAREWLTDRLLGGAPLPLMGLAIRDLARLGTDEEVAAGAELQADQVSEWHGVVTSPFDQAIKNRVKAAGARREAERQRQEAAQREQERVKRAARKAQRDAERAAVTGANGTGKAATNGG